MMSNDTALRVLGERYHLQLEGVGVWTPYWINWDEPPYKLNSPYRGKGTPGQIRTAAERVLSRLVRRPTTAEAMRLVLREHGLGVDCSGFAYYVLDRYLRGTVGSSLANWLRVDRADIEEVLRRHPERVGSLGDGPVPEWMPLPEVCRRWRKDPIVLADVRRLTDPRIARLIKRAEDIRPGDLIKMTSRHGDHVAVVCGVTAQDIEYMASEDEANGLGGVRFRLIRLTNPGQGLEYQEWEQKGVFHPGSHGDGVWRVIALDGV